jgi:5-methylcytosine-specific restriction endonuclease McrA
MGRVLVLSASFEPFKIVSWKKAILLVFQNKAEVLEEYDKSQFIIRSVTKTFKVPSVLKLRRIIPKNQNSNRISFTRKNVLLRDQNTCQYCGRKRPPSELTLDHVTPVVQGGKKTWDNIVTACKPCNQKKGGRTPEQANMKLLKKPTEPYWFLQNISNEDLQQIPEKWKFYTQWLQK